MKFKKIIIGLITLLILLFFSINMFFRLVPKDDLSEIKGNINTREEIYRSPSGLGGDRHSIYEFDLKNVENISMFKKSHEYSYFSYYMKDTESLKDIMSEGISENLKIEIIKKINNLTQEKDVKYLIVDDKDNGIEKLYIYSKNLNKGYCIYFKY